MTSTDAGQTPGIGRSGVTLARYQDLPEIPELGVRHAWGLLPNETGTLAKAGPAEVVAGAQLVSQGLTIPLNLPINAFNPPLFGRATLVHTVVQPTRIDSEDVIDGFNPQASSQLDGLAHVRAREFGYFGGIATLEEARDKIGMHHWATRGIAGRGVLLDMESFDQANGDTAGPFAGKPYVVEDLLTVARGEGVELRAGDILLTRTGWAASFLKLSTEEREAVRGWNGLRADEDMAEFLWNQGISLVGSDNPAVEDAPGDRSVGSLHRRLLPSLGLPLMELLDLERLSVACQERGSWEFFFVSVPMNLEGAVSSPANAMAIL
jgi:hypothetical protein